MRRIRAGTLLFAALSLLLLCFIWGQSLLPRSQSAAESRFLMDVIKPLLDPGNRIPEELFHHYLRKAAHFAEYAALGFCLCGFFCSLRRGAAVLPAIGASVFAAAADEGIQLFSEGRGAQISDVALDSCGALFGLAVFLLLTRLLHRSRKTHE